MTPIDPDTAREIGLVVFDVDGVLTDAGIYWTDPVDGEARGVRRFDVRDGMGIYMLSRADIPVALVSGKDSPAVRARGHELGIDEVHQVPPHRKVPVVEGMLAERGLTWSEVASLADDLADVAVMERAALPAAVADAVEEVRDRAAWVAETPGGHGVVREFTEALLRARGEWDDLAEAYVARGRGEEG